MNSLCAHGSGELPRYVEWIDWRRPGGVIHLAGGDATLHSQVVCATDGELHSHCRQLAEQRYLFSIGGRAGLGPADLMDEWQKQGLIPISFLQVSWTGLREWQVHEIVSGIQEWDIRPLAEILATPPRQLGK